MLINATATIATARDNGSVLKNCDLSAFASNCDNLQEAHIFNICSGDVYKRSRPSAVMDLVHDPENHNLEWTHSRTDTIPNGHDLEWTRSRMITYIYMVTLVVYVYCLIRSLLKRQGFK